MLTSDIAGQIFASWTGQQTEDDFGFVSFEQREPGETFAETVIAYVEEMADEFGRAQDEPITAEDKEQAAEAIVQCVQRYVTDARDEEDHTEVEWMGWVVPEPAEKASVSLSSSTMAALRAKAEEDGTSVSAIADDLLRAGLGLWQARRAKPGRPW